MAPREKALPKRMFSDPESWAMAVVAAAARAPRRKLRLTIFENLGVACEENVIEYTTSVRFGVEKKVGLNWKWLEQSRPRGEEQRDAVL